MNALNCLRVVELSNTQSKEREDKACCKLTQHFLISFTYGSLLRMHTFFTIYNFKGCWSQRLVGVTQGNVSLNIMWINAGHQTYDVTRKLDLFSVVPMFSQFFPMFPWQCVSTSLVFRCFPLFPYISLFFPCFPPCFCSFLLLCFQLVSFVFPCFLLFSYLFLFPLFFPVSP